jgi:oxygen-independent coproporphyrinogen-3 oxidase
MEYSASLSGVYIDAVCRELILRRETSGRLKTVYIGGGTPSILSEGCLKKLFRSIEDNFAFSSHPEITVEINPGTLTKSKGHLLRSLGVNRISIGAQSFSNCELQILGRAHLSSDTAGAVKILKKAGFENISIDLIYGIPMQTVSTWQETLLKAIQLSVPHVSAYELTPAVDTPFYDLLNAKKIALPGEQHILDMYHDTIDSLTGSGYIHYEISNFAMPDYRCIHNCTYWDGGQYAGVGAGAHSFISGIRSKNTDTIQQYIDHVNNGIIPQSEAVQLRKGDRLKEYIFLGLRKREGISLDRLRTSGYQVLESCDDFVESGFMEMDADSLRLTRKGLTVANTVIVNLFQKSGLD